MLVQLLAEFRPGRETSEGFKADGREFSEKSSAGVFGFSVVRRYLFICCTTVFLDNIRNSNTLLRDASTLLTHNTLLTDANMILLELIDVQHSQILKLLDEKTLDAPWWLLTI